MPAATLCACGTVLLVLAATAQAGRCERTAAHATPASLLAAPIDEAPSFLSGASQADMLLGDVEFAAQSWRWSAGTSAFIAVLVRVDVLQVLTRSRIGGLYGP